MRTARMRIGAGLLACAAALAIVGCKKEIYHALTELEANEVVVVLAEYGIEADKVPDKAGDSKKGQLYMITVEETRSIDAKRILLDENLPHTRQKGLADLFAAPSMIPTETEERARYLTALQGELASSLEAVDGVVSAKVNLVLPEANPLEAGRELTTARATVLIKHKGKAGDVKDTDKVAKDNEFYKATLISLSDDLRRLRTIMTKELPDIGKVEKGALAALDTTFFTDKRADDPEVKAAKAHFERLKQASLERDGKIRQLDALPRVKDLDKVLAKMQDLELEALPFASASVRALISHAVPRLGEDDVSVEFTKVQPKPLKERVAPAGPTWLRREVVLGLAGLSAALAIAIIGLAFFIMNLKKQVTQARQAAAKAASASLGASMAPPG